MLNKELSIFVVTAHILFSTYDCRMFFFIYISWHRKLTKVPSLAGSYFHNFNLFSHKCKSYMRSLYSLLIFPMTGAVALLLLLAVALLCAYELCAVYVTSSRASMEYSPSGFFFGVSAVALAINMLFICRMVFNGELPVLKHDK